MTDGLELLSSDASNLRRVLFVHSGGSARRTGLRQQPLDDPANERQAPIGRTSAGRCDDRKSQLRMQRQISHLPARFLCHCVLNVAREPWVVDASRSHAPHAPVVASCYKQAATATSGHARRNRRPGLDTSGMNPAQSQEDKATFVIADRHQPVVSITPYFIISPPAETAFVSQLAWPRSNPSRRRRRPVRPDDRTAGALRWPRVIQEP